MKAIQQVGETIVNLFLEEYWVVNVGTEAKPKYVTECPLCSWTEEDVDHDEHCPIPSAIEELELESF